MNAETPILDLEECTRFILFWLEVINAPHVTLIGIVPDAATTACTFERGDLDALGSWIAAQQQSGSNVYFQPNETRPGCRRKPGKADMVAASCRFADIDPQDNLFPLADERQRLAALATHLSRDAEFAPTAIIDSGNGLQPIWAVIRESLSPTTIVRVEEETKAIEAVLGAGGTHDVSRLLRLPGTLNFPNAKKRSLGRGVTRARLIFSAPNLYSNDQTARLPAHLSVSLASTDLVRPKPLNAKPGVETQEARTTSGSSDPDEESLIRALEGVGADAISSPDHLPVALRCRLQDALNARSRLAGRWAGSAGDLTEAGRDASRSGIDLSLAAMLKGAGFSQLDTALILCAFQHGKTNGDDWRHPAARLRHVARSVIRSHDPGTVADPIEALVEEFNSRYAVVNEMGKALVYELAHDAVLNRRHYDRISFEDLKRLYLNRRIQVGRDGHGKPITKPVADVWLQHADRRQFIGGVVFDPSGRRVPPGALNLWQGFAVQPRPGSWTRMKDHILKVICRGNQDHLDFLMGWMARLVQYPAEQGEVAIVMRGAEGTGKGTLVKALLHIVGQHGLAVSNSKHLTGNFNGHLRDTILLFADEAFFAGDRGHVGVLKSLITEPHLTIEAKFQNALQMPNYIHLMMASNEDWVVPASVDARRFFVLEVSPVHANDHAYFAAIAGEMANGGHEAMLHDLLHYDLTFFNHRRPPVTVGLQSQMKMSLPAAEAWWLESLHRGYVFKSRVGLEAYFGQWHDQMASEILFDAYVAHAKASGERHPMGREVFGKFMIRMGATACRPRNMVIGEHIADVANNYGGTNRKAELVRVDRGYAYRLYNLQAARDNFKRATGLETEWPDEDSPEV